MFVYYVLVLIFVCNFTSKHAAKHSNVMNMAGSALPGVHGSTVAESDDEFDDYWMSSAAVACNLGTYDAEGQRVVQVLYSTPQHVYS